MNSFNGKNPEYFEDLDWTTITQQDFQQIEQLYNSDKKAFFSKFRDPECAEKYIREVYEAAKAEDKAEQKRLAVSEPDEFVRNLMLKNAPPHVIEFWRGMREYTNELERDDEKHFTIRPGMNEKLDRIVAILDREYGNGLREFMTTKPAGDPDNPFSWHTDEPLTESDIGKVYRRKVRGLPEEEIVVEINGSGMEISSDIFDEFKDVIGTDTMPELFVNFDGGITKMTFMFYHNIYDEH